MIKGDITSDICNCNDINRARRIKTESICSFSENTFVKQSSARHKMRMLLALMIQYHFNSYSGRLRDLDGANKSQWSVKFKLIQPIKQ